MFFRDPSGAPNCPQMRGKEKEGRGRKKKGAPWYPGERIEGETVRNEGFMLLVRRGADWGGVPIAVVPVGKKRKLRKEGRPERRGEGNGV